MNNRINRTVEKFNMLSKGDNVLVACSGGADSMLLLCYLLDIRREYDLTVQVAHVEHGIRGQESVDDMCFVRDFCVENDIKFHLLSIDALNESKCANMSVEEYSRQRRYEFFSTIRCDKIATAHNLNDNVETLLFRLARGTGLKGACGIAPVRDNIIRPLIEISSQDIRDYCNKSNISYRVDSTNAENDYARNYIRNVVVPDLEHLNSRFADNTAQFITALNEDNAFIEQCANDAYAGIVADNKLSLESLKSLSPAISKRVVLRYFSDNGVKLDRVHLESVMSLVEKRGREQIKGNIFAVSDAQYLRIACFDSVDADFTFTAQILKIDEFIGDNIDFYCDYGKIVGSVTVRQRMSGDTIKPYKRNCTKSLKKLFNEYKIPEELRKNVGVVTDELGVIGIIGYCVADRVAVRSDTQSIFSLRLQSED